MHLSIKLHGQKSGTAPGAIGWFCSLFSRAERVVGQLHPSWWQTTGCLFNGCGGASVNCVFHQMSSPQLTISGSPGIPLVNQKMKFVALSKGLSSQHRFIQESLWSLMTLILILFSLALGSTWIIDCPFPGFRVMDFSEKSPW